jgi:hypothetical protein
MHSRLMDKVKRSLSMSWRHDSAGYSGVLMRRACESEAVDSIEAIGASDMPTSDQAVSQNCVSGQKSNRASQLLYDLPCYQPDWVFSSRSFAISSCRTECSRCYLGLADVIKSSLPSQSSGPRVVNALAKSKTYVHE